MVYTNAVFRPQFPMVSCVWKIQISNVSCSVVMLVVTRLHKKPWPESGYYVSNCVAISHFFWLQWSLFCMFLTTFCHFFRLQHFLHTQCCSSTNFLFLFLVFPCLGSSLVSWSWVFLCLGFSLVLGLPFSWFFPCLGSSPTTTWLPSPKQLWMIMWLCIL